MGMAIADKLQQLAEDTGLADTQARSVTLYGHEGGVEGVGLHKEWGY